MDLVFSVQYLDTFSDTLRRELVLDYKMRPVYESFLFVQNFDSLILDK